MWRDGVTVVGTAGTPNRCVTQGGDQTSGSTKMSLKALGLAGVAAATLMTSTVAMTAQADARGWGGRGYHGGGWGGRGYYGGGYRRGGFGWGGAGAGLAAGLALGALAARPAYGYGYGGGYYGGGYAPAYYGGYGYAPAYYGGGCYWKPRRVWGPYGWQYARVRVCY